MAIVFTAEFHLLSRHAQTNGSFNMNVISFLVNREPIMIDVRIIKKPSPITYN